MIDKTPHQHWSHYDENNEMKSFNEFQEGLLNGSDVSLSAVKLASLAQSYGYGEADSHLTDKASREKETIETAAYDESYAGYMDGDYWNCIDVSESILRKAVTTPQQLSSARAVCQSMRDAFERGRAMRTDEEIPSPQP